MMMSKEAYEKYREKLKKYPRQKRFFVMFDELKRRNMLTGKNLFDAITIVARQNTEEGKGEIGERCYMLKGDTMISPDTVIGSVVERIKGEFNPDEDYSVTELEAEGRDGLVVERHLPNKTIQRIFGITERDGRRVTIFLRQKIIYKDGYN